MTSVNVPYTFNSSRHDHPSVVHDHPSVVHDHPSVVPGRLLAAPAWAILLALAVIIGLAPAARADDPSLKLEQILPAETVLFAKCSGVNQLMADLETLELYKLWNEEEVQTFFAKALAMLPQMVEGAKGPDVPMKAIWDLFQGELAFAVSPRMTITHEAPMPSMALAVDMAGNREAFLKTMHGFKDMAIQQAGLDTKTYDYRGHKVVTLGEAKKRINLCFTVVDNLFVGTLNHYFLHDIIDCRMDDRPVLAAVPAFQRSLKRVGGDGVDLLTFLNLKPFTRIVAPFLPYEIQAVLNDLGAEDLGGLCLASTIEQGSARDSFFLDLPGEKKGLLKALHPHPVTRANLKRTPQDALLFYDFVLDLEGIAVEIDRFVEKNVPEFYGEFRQGIDEMQRHTGFDLMKDILGPLGSEVCFFVTMGQNNSVNVIPDLFLTLDLDDPAGFENFMSRIFAMADGEIQVIESMFEGKTMRRIVPPEKEIPFQPTLLVDGNKLLAASSPMAMKKYLRWLKSGQPGLADLPDFQRAFEGVPANATAIEFMNLKRGAELGYGLGQPFVMNFLDQEETPFDGGLLPMQDTVTSHVTNAVSYSVMDEDGVLMSSRWPLGMGAVLSIAVSVVDHLVDRDLLMPLIANMDGPWGRGHGRRIDVTNGFAAKSSSKRSDLDVALELMQQGEFEAAEALFGVWIGENAKDPRATLALTNQGYCLLAQNKIESAIKAYTKVTGMPGGNKGLAHYNLACAYARLEKVEMALDHLEQAVKNGWGDAGHMQQDPDMDNLRGHERYKKVLETIR